MKPPENVKPDYFTIEMHIRKEKTDKVFQIKTDGYLIKTEELWLDKSEKNTPSEVFFWQKFTKGEVLYNKPSLITGMTKYCRVLSNTLNGMKLIVRALLR
jgi:hypothetical protein